MQKMLIITKWSICVVICMDWTPFKRVVANFSQDKNDNEYNEDLEMDMHPVIKPHVN